MPKSIKCCCLQGYHQTQSARLKCQYSQKLIKNTNSREHENSCRCENCEEKRLSILSHAYARKQLRIRMNLSLDESESETEKLPDPAKFQGYFLLLNFHGSKMYYNQRS